MGLGQTPNLDGQITMVNMTPIVELSTLPIAPLGKLLPALLAAKREMGPLIRNSINPFHKNRYADLEAVVAVSEAPLGLHGLVVVQTTDVQERGVGLVTRLYHESGEYLESWYPLKPKSDDPQGLAAALTYARRYALMALLGLAPEDDDGETASARPAKGAPPSPKAPTPKPSLPATAASTQSAGAEPPHDPVTGEVRGAVAHNPPGALATPPQLKMFHALRRQLAWSDEATKAWLKAQTGQESSKAVPVGRMSELIGDLEHQMKDRVERQAETDGAQLGRIAAVKGGAK